MSTENVSNEEKGNGVLAMLPTRKVCFFKLKNKKYLTENGIEITTEMLVKYPHQITETWSFIVLD
jgi:glutaredoxin